MPLRNTFRITDRSVTSVLVASTLGVVLLCTIGVLAVQHFSYSASLQRQFRDRVEAEAREMGLHYRRMIGEAQSQLMAMTEDNAIRVTLQLEVEYQLQERMAHFSAHAPHLGFYIRSAEKERLYSASPEPVPVEAFELFALPAPHVGKLSLAPDGRFYVALTRYIRSRTGILGTAVAICYLGKAAESPYQPDRSGTVLVNHYGVFRELSTGNPVSLELRTAMPDSSGPALSSVAGQAGLLTETGFPDMLYLAPLSPLEDARRTSLYVSAALLLTTALLCVLLAYFLGRRITRPLRELAESARKITLGENPPLLQGASSLREVNDVLHAMDAMLDNLRKAEELTRYRTLFEEVVDAIYIFDMDGRLLECNSQALAQVGCDRERLMKMGILDLTGPEYRRKVLQVLDAMRKAPAGTRLASRRFEIRILPVQGAPFPAEIHNRKMLYMGQEAVLSVVRDISTRLAVEETLHKARKAAEDASRAKSGFLASMSHEIRTPMHSVLGFVDMLEATQLTEEQSGYLEMLRNSGLLLMDLINDILDFSKIEAGHLELEHIEFSPEALLERVHGMVGTQASRKGLEVILYIAPDVPRRVVGDPTRLQQILVNLLSNALKFTALGHVVTQVLVRSRTEREVVLEISVKDTGVGIPETKQDVIFDIFTQADVSTSRQYGGTGLGLAITRRLVEHLGGSIGVDSKPGQGATFTFTVVLPLPGGHRAFLDTLDGSRELAEHRELAAPEGLTESGEQPESPESPESPEEACTLPLAGLHFLLVDGNAVTLRYLAQTVSDMGGSSACASSMEQAYRLLEDHVRYARVQHDAERPGVRDEAAMPDRYASPPQQMHPVPERFDVLVMGTNMPELDALSALRHLARMAGEHLPPALHLADPGGDAPGGNAFPATLPVLIKPVTPGRLAATVEALFAKSSAEDEDAVCAAAEPEDATRRRVLVAEDSQANRMLMGFFLKDSPFIPDYAEDGRQAVRMFRSRSYDAVIMDIQMPGMDGYAATQAIRAYEKERGRAPVPVIALTANAYAEDKEKSLAAGCTDYLAKPAKKRQVLDLLNRHLAGTGAGAA
ncbi:hybrid sensor histidine kinase/response regulator [Desulfovibrio psychrotolerans]|uniref:histidine kinase n=1 Tax=Desulfovibrio psychrotolerans TaxID=415242 RepID=A0A7J0BY61_9BACT|nr:ATP-binding protein [Desulfovibrio psychrotolerans]GFM38623.1 hypothetical protein DSM19430T_33070 [Desulfovibrio psychrotolerans]